MYIITARRMASGDGLKYRNRIDHPLRLIATLDSDWFNLAASLAANEMGLAP
jgi:hypothetical protein